MGQGFHQPPICKCFSDFGVGGYCYKNFGCPNKSSKTAKAKRKLKNIDKEPTGKYSLNGKLVTSRADIRVWINPSTGTE